MALLGLLLAGCGLISRRDRATAYSTQSSPEPYPLVERATTQALHANLAALHEGPQHRGRKLEVLVVCAAGCDSPFTAGAIVGWTKAGNRPSFDVVTGTSSGALIGMFAFLGPKYDGRLEALFTGLSSNDLFDLRPVRYLLRDGAVASPEPLEAIIAREITDEFMADMRAAHAEGRRLFIGTTNVATKRLVVWDLGAIASSGQPDAALLLRKIVLASATWPALLPPVTFDVQIGGQTHREQHIDGGTAAQAFVRFGPMADWPSADHSQPGWLAGSNLYVLAGGKLYDEGITPPERFFGRILNGFGCVTASLARADMQHLHTLCLASGMRFHLLALPDDYQGSQHSLLKIDPVELRRLFAAGERLVAADSAWRHLPPGAGPGEEEVPRGAVLSISSEPRTK